MKSFKTVLVLAATVSVSLLAGCGVEATEDSYTDTLLTQEALASEGSEDYADDDAAAAQECTGSITCSNATTSVSVQCRPNGTQCKATCPLNTKVTAGACAWVVAPVPPAPAPEPVP